MRGAESFFDTSVLLYVLSSDTPKADKVEKLLEQAGFISVQVLNEFTSVALRKLKMPMKEIQEILGTVRTICRTTSLTIDDHDQAMAIADRYKFSFYDSVIVASALRAGCNVLYSEDLQHRQIISQSLTIINPFVTY